MRQRKGGASNRSVSLLCLPAGNELLYRSRDGDVIRYNVETEEKSILVHNKKFVSALLFNFPTGPKDWLRLAGN